MNAGTLLKLVGQIYGALETNGYITPTGEFVAAKFNSAESDLALIASLEDAFKQDGVNIPNKVDKVIKMLPLIFALVA